MFTTLEQRLCATLDQKLWPPNVYDVEPAWTTLDLNEEIHDEFFRRTTDEDSAFESSTFEDSSSGTLWDSAFKYRTNADRPLLGYHVLDTVETEEALLSPWMNPVTYQLVSSPIFLDVRPRGDPEPYSAWTHDHDYIIKDIKTESVEEKSRVDIIKSESEPDCVDVWEISSFPGDSQTAVPGRTNAWNKYLVEATGRRSSTRTAELKRKIQARTFTTAVTASLKNCKPKRTRQYKNIKPKNSVETTPSQSDIEEWSSYPAKPSRRPTSTKTTKKKTSKGRIDHSESERHRREVLRSNFAALCEIIPKKYLRGEKASSQISKQKILNGAKAYIDVLRSCKGSYKIDFLQNQRFKEKWLKRSSLLKLLKCNKKK